MRGVQWGAVDEFAMVGGSGTAGLALPIVRLAIVIVEGLECRFLRSAISKVRKEGPKELSGPR